MTCSIVEVFAYFLIFVAVCNFSLHKLIGGNSFLCGFQCSKPRYEQILNLRSFKKDLGPYQFSSVLLNFFRRLILYVYLIWSSCYFDLYFVQKLPYGSYYSFMVIIRQRSATAAISTNLFLVLVMTYNCTNAKLKHDSRL